MRECLIDLPTTWIGSAVRRSAGGSNHRTADNPSGKRPQLPHLRPMLDDRQSYPADHALSGYRVSAAQSVTPVDGQPLPPINPAGFLTRDTGVRAMTGGFSIFTLHFQK
ncbi:hypothetical protein DMB37_39650 [Nocardia sp. CS682]|nr:hypothetical protein DMB37_39650 [Nocardia sp. CS682]